MIRLTESLPHLWYPRCASCGRQATPRAGLGDARGPQPLPHETLACAECGATVRIDERTAWIDQPLESGA